MVTVIIVLLAIATVVSLHAIADAVQSSPNIEISQTSSFAELPHVKPGDIHSSQTRSLIVHFWASHEATQQ